MAKAAPKVSVDPRREEADRELAHGWIKALCSHIVSVQAYAADREYKDVASGLQYVRKCVETDTHHPAGFWRSYAGALALFVRRHEEMAPIVQGLRTRDYPNTSRRTLFDPLTEVGLGDVMHLVHNGLYDDWWIALYKGQDGDRRIVNETIDDACQLREWPNDKPVPHLDKNMGWLRGAEKRFKLNPAVFEAEFLASLTSEDLTPPSAGQLSEMWAERPYSDFIGQPRP